MGLTMNYMWMLIYAIKTICIDHSCKVSTVNDTRILCLKINSHSSNLMLLNVYLPHYCPDNIDEYSLYIGKVASIIEGHDTDQVMTLGDFNAGLHGAFYNEWSDVIFMDVEKLPLDSYTRVNYATLHRKWLHHWIWSPCSIAINYSSSCSDRLPLYHLVCRNEM